MDFANTVYVLHSFSVPANFRSLVYFYGIKNGGVKEWDFAFQQFQKTTVASERRKILYGLAGASEPWILSRYSIPALCLGRHLGSVYEESCGVHMANKIPFLAIRRETIPRQAKRNT